MSIAPASPAAKPTIPTTILCVASYFKGNDFIRQAKAEGAHVVLLTGEALLKKPWARESIDEIFALPDLYDRRAMINAVSYLARTRDITRMTPLDDYDVETVAMLREHLRVPGMGETTARYFRDKLAMRTRARERGINVPDFVGAINPERIQRYLETVPGPWLLKPRSEASSVGIKKIFHAKDVWPILEQLGDAASNHLIEKMIPGDVFHVDAITWDKKIVFVEAHGYRKPLLEVVQGGGLFSTITVERGSGLEKDLLDCHAQILENLGFVRGVTHTELIRGTDGKMYFLETAARVGGVHIADLVEASTGVNLWREWARVEVNGGDHPYAPPPARRDYSGMIVTLARQEHPDTTSYADPEICWRMTDNPHHVGLIVKSPDRARVVELIESYEPRVRADFMAQMPAPKAATA
jgi:hypothetical protein